MATGRISPITNELYTQGNLIFEPHNGILYNFEIYDNYIELRYFLTKFVVKIIPFGDRFYMWDELSRVLEKLHKER